MAKTVFAAFNTVKRKTGEHTIALSCCKFCFETLGVSMYSFVISEVFRQYKTVFLSERRRERERLKIIYCDR